jgi:hypothetical protein
MRRLYLLILTFCCCLIGAIVGVYLSIRLDANTPSVVAAAAFPVLGAYIGGIRDRCLLAKIAGYALLGWLLCFILQPQVSRVVSRSPSIDDQFGGKLWHLFCFVPSSLLAIVAVLFAPGRLTRRCPPQPVFDS